MNISRDSLIVAIIGVALLSRASFADRLVPQWQTECPVTVAVPDKGQEWKDVFYFGGDVLTVHLFVDGWWHGSSRDKNFRGRLWWVSERYDGLTDQTPPLTVKGRRIDKNSSQSAFAMVTNATNDDGEWAMLSVLEFPEAGCWEIEGDYGGQRLTFVVLVGKHRHDVASDT